MTQENTTKKGLLSEYASLFPYIRSLLPRYILGVLFLLVTDIGQLLIPYYIGKGVDHIAHGAIDTTYIISLMTIVIGASVAVAAGRFLWKNAIMGASFRVVRKIREHLFSHIIRLTSTFFGNNKTGDLMARSTNDVDAVHSALSWGVVAFIDGLMMGVGIVIILFIRYPDIALIILAPLPLITLLVLGLGPAIGRLFKEVQEGYSLLSECAQENLTGIRVIKSFVREEFVLERFTRANNIYLKANIRLMSIWGVMFPLVMFLSGLTSMLLLRYGGFKVLSAAITPGDFTAILFYLGLLSWPMMGIGFTINLLQRGGASLSRINEILREKPDITESKTPQTIPERPTLTVRELSYTPPGSDTEILSSINFEVPFGETLGILGPTGSGKTTLTRLLTRLSDPPPGRLFLGDVDIRDTELNDLRRRIIPIAQESFLFSLSIRNNIFYGNRKANVPLFDSIIDETALAGDIGHLSLGMETEIGERGITLSGGQKQRLCLARGLLAAPDIVIIDDSLSAIDTETEELILNNLFKRVKGKTLLIVSNRISTLRRTDRVAVIEKGKLTQYGSHKELMSQDGFYRYIAEIQSIVV